MKGVLRSQKGGLRQRNHENPGKWGIIQCEVTLHLPHCKVWLSSVGSAHAEGSSQAITGWPFTVTSFADGFTVIFSSHIHHAALSRSSRAVLHIQFVFACSINEATKGLFSTPDARVLLRGSASPGITPLLQTKHTFISFQTQTSINSSHTRSKTNASMHHNCKCQAKWM